MGDESRFRYRLLDEGQTREGAPAGRAPHVEPRVPQPRAPEGRGRVPRDYDRVEPTYAPEPNYAPEPGYAREADYPAEPSYAPEPTYAPRRAAAPAVSVPARAPAGGGQDSLAELAKLIGDQDPFADFAELEQDTGAPEPDPYAAPEPRLDARAAPRATGSTLRAEPRLRTTYEPEPAPRQMPALRSDPALRAEPALRPERGYSRPAAEPRAYDPAPPPAAPQDTGSYDAEEYEADDYDDRRGYDEPRHDDARHDDARYDDAAYDARSGYDDAAYGRTAAQEPAYDDYTPSSRTAARAPQLPARLSATREEPALSSRDTGAARAPLPVPAATSRLQPGAVRTGYGSLARQQPAVAAPKPDEDDGYDAYDSRTGDARAYDDRGYDDRGYDDRTYDDRGYDDRRADNRAYDGRGYDDQGYDARGYAEQDYDDQGYDTRTGSGRSYRDDGRGYDRGEAAYAYSDARRGGDGYDTYDDAYDPDFAADGYMPPHGEEVYENEPRRRKGRMALLMVASVIGLLVAGIAAFFAYRMAVGAPGLVSGAPPVIRADASPAKEVTPPPPAQEGSQKLIYDRVGDGANPNERMVPREEQPVDVASASTGTTGAGATEPKRVRTLTVRADGTIVQDAAPSATSPAPPGSPVTAYAPNQNPIPTDLPAPTTVSTVPAAGLQTASTSNPPVSASGAYVVQVASQRSEADAMGSWRALQQRYPNLLGGYRASVKRADLGERGVYYRAQVGPFASRDQANELCQALRAQGGDCLVNKN